VANLLVKTALNEASAKEEIIALLGSLGDYAFYHLKTEEDYFDKFKYPDAAEHIAEHNKYRDQVKKYFDILKDEKADIKKMGKEAAIFSGNWLYHHILLVDTKYTKFFIEKGLE
jgi:hemerythrin-like metal-binding protein